MAVVTDCPLRVMQDVRRRDRQEAAARSGVTEFSVSIEP